MSCDLYYEVHLLGNILTYGESLMATECVLFFSKNFTLNMFRPHHG